VTRFVALLRGVNVGGITIRMADLAGVFRGLGFDNVRTVLASGNVCFDSDAVDAAALKSRIEAALRESFGYDAWIVLVTRDELERTVGAFPFDAAREGWHPYVLFGSDPAMLAELLDSARGLDETDDVVAPGDGVIYWHNRRAIGVKSAFSMFAAKSRYRSSTTNRNLRTLVKLLA
jgi:uncharacterized protein (DUF1697 family)